MKIYTFGYQKQSPERLKRAAETLNAKVIDIRFSPLPTYTANKWSKKQLEILLGEQYEWLKAFGNRNYKNGGAIEILDPQAGTARILELVGETRMVETSHTVLDSPISTAHPHSGCAEEYVFTSAPRWDALILLCACADYEQCHRKEVIEYEFAGTFDAMEIVYAGELVKSEAWGSRAEPLAETQAQPTLL